MGAATAAGCVSWSAALCTAREWNPPICLPNMRQRCATRGWAAKMAGRKPAVKQLGILPIVATRTATRLACRVSTDQAACGHPRCVPPPARPGGAPGRHFGHGPAPRLCLAAERHQVRSSTAGRQALAFSGRSCSPPCRHAVHATCTASSIELSCLSIREDTSDWHCPPPAPQRPSLRAKAGRCRHQGGGGKSA